MAEPYLLNVSNWETINLVPDRSSQFILQAESGGTPKTTEDSYWDGTIQWLTPKEITRGNGALFVSETERKITESGLRSSGAKLMPVGTVMLSKRAPVGAVAIAAVPMTTNQGFLNFVCGLQLRPVYFAEWLKVNKPYLDAVANGSTYAELYKTDLFEFEMNVPPIEEQDLILEVLMSMNRLINGCVMLEQSSARVEEIEDLQKRKRELESLQSTLSPILLSGAIKDLRGLLVGV